MRSKRGFVMPELVALAFLLFLLAALSAPAAIALMRKWKNEQCSSNLSQLWRTQYNYMCMYGGCMKAMPTDTGPRFWVVLRSTKPALIDSSNEKILRCPARRQPPAVSGTDYRGPRRNVNSYLDSYAVGADLVDNHGAGTGGNVLLKTGYVLKGNVSDALWDLADRKTIP